MFSSMLKVRNIGEYNSLFFFSYSKYASFFGLFDYYIFEEKGTSIIFLIFKLSIFNYKQFFFIDFI